MVKVTSVGQLPTTVNEISASQARILNKTSKVYKLVAPASEIPSYVREYAEAHNMDPRGLMADETRYFVDMAR